MAELESENLYEMNKRLMGNEKPIDTILRNRKISAIAKAMQPNEYYLLICPDLRQYVFFHSNNESSESIRKDALTEVLLNRGIIIDIDDKGESVWEIWIRDKFDNGVYLYQLTNYTEQVVEV